MNLLIFHCCAVGAGTLYFTSIRRAKGEPFTISENHMHPSRIVRPILTLHLLSTVQSNR